MIIKKKDFVHVPPHVNILDGHLDQTFTVVVDVEWRQLAKKKA